MCGLGCQPTGIVGGLGGKARFWARDLGQQPENHSRRLAIFAATECEAHARIDKVTASTNGIRTTFDSATSVHRSDAWFWIEKSAGDVDRIGSE